MLTERQKHRNPYSRIRASFCDFIDFIKMG